MISSFLDVIRWSGQLPQDSAHFPALVIREALHEPRELRFHDLFERFLIVSEGAVALRGFEQLDEITHQISVGWRSGA